MIKIPQNVCLVSANITEENPDFLYIHKNCFAHPQSHSIPPNHTLARLLTVVYNTARRRVFRTLLVAPALLEKPEQSRLSSASSDRDVSI